MSAASAADMRELGELRDPAVHFDSRPALDVARDTHGQP
jgi:hypothetical protein